jgi:hypothetical protein
VSMGPDSLLPAACDDGELTKATNKLYGVLLLEILKGLQREEKLSPFPT